MKPSAILCFLAAAATALAAPAAEKFAYRGTLANADGSAFASALPMQMTFRLYDRASGGSPLWGRTRPVRVEANGTFYIELSDDKGSPSDPNLPYSELAVALASRNGDFWIGLSPGDYSEMAPRQRLAAVPCALHAVTANTITDLRAGTLSAPVVHAGEAVIGKLVVTDSLQPPGGGGLNFDFSHGGTLTANQLVKLTGGIDGFWQYPISSDGTFSGFQADTFAISREASKGWTSSFLPGGDGSASVHFPTPQEAHAWSYGRKD